MYERYEPSSDLRKPYVTNVFGGAPNSALFSVIQWIGKNKLKLFN